MPVKAHPKRTHTGKPQRRCRADECDGKPTRRGLCEKHYRRLRRLGSLELPTLADRFWPKVQKTEDGCWLWMSSKGTNGYPLFSVDGKEELAHRVSYELEVGPIPPGVFVRHWCDTPLCVRPEHLLLGNQQQNVADMLERGRGGYQRRNNPRQKLFDEDRARIRQRLAEGARSTALAAEYGVHEATIRKVGRG